MEIKWFPVCGYIGLYEWNPQTQEVKGLKRGKVLKWNYDRNGRPCVTLYKNGVKRTFYKAMFVYSHTHQVEIHIGYDVHHIDFNHQNNDPSNLQLLTKEEHKKLHAKTREIFQKNNVLASKAVMALDANGNVVHRFPSLSEAGRNSFDPSAVSKACRGCFHREGNHYYKGYYWYYEQEWLRLQ